MGKGFSVTGPSSGDQNQYYRQQEERAEKTREQARSLRGDDPEEPTEAAGSARSSETRSSETQAQENQASETGPAGSGSRAAADSGEAGSTEEERGS